MGAYAEAVQLSANGAWRPCHDPLTGNQGLADRPDGGTNLRIWGSEVRILSGAPVYDTSRVNRTPFARTVMPNVEVDASRAFSEHELGLPIWVQIWSASRSVTCLSLQPGSSRRMVPCLLARAWTVGGRLAVVGIGAAEFAVSAIS